MPQLIVLLLVGLGIYLYWSGFLERMNAVLVVRLYQGQAVVERGRLSVEGRQRLEDIAREAQLTDGVIRVSRQRKTRFSRQIPTACHQPIRNVLASELSSERA